MSSFAHQITTNGSTNGSTNGTHNDSQRAEPSGISVLIIGAGVGGLVAALECYRKGHDVRVLERSDSASAGGNLGDMFTIGLSGRRFVRHYPAMAKELDEISVHNGWTRFRKHTGDDIGAPFPSNMPPGTTVAVPADEQPMVMQLRPLFHRMLYNQIQRFGIDVSYGRRIVEYYEDADRGVAGIVTDKGEREEADLVIAADGLSSHSRDVVLGGQGKGKPSGRSIVRAAIPLETAMADPLVAEYFGLKDGKDPVMQPWMGPETHAMVLSYADKQGENKQLLWGLTYTELSTAAQSTTESWQNSVSNEDVLRLMEKVLGWGEPMKALVRTMPEGSIIFWPLLWRNPNPLVHSKGGRVLQIGDAAHTFLPTSGNGATQAIEDAVTIAACLQHAGKADIPAAVRTHALLRGDRVATAQFLGFYNAERFQKADMKAIGKDAKKVDVKVPKWIYTSDPEKYADANFAKAKASLEGGELFKNTNIPEGYEPEPWTMEGIERLYAEGKQVELKGDWS
ncbi:hypothetical protein LTR56_004859 [Elasticomyces elasticus]|nr:hypothetical protein LTR56_004859 [Elasticomyces elasticus]KAK3664633.1 hypothetical protein LTR22_004501 [Elasticomyces elasticus]KAK5760343.1 hypothetical protein LTS12_009557 [Elasticomyces elasticus]